MEKISDIEKQIMEIEKQIEANRKATLTAEERVRNAQRRTSEIESETASLREQRQAALVKGEDSGVSSKKIDDLKREDELKREEVSGLNAYLFKLKSEGDKTSSELLRLKKRIPQLQSVALAKEYNTVAVQLANIVRELNEIQFKLEREGNLDDRTVFSLMEGSLIRIPRLLFDEDAVKLEDFVARHPGVYPSNLNADARCFYDWETHRNNLIYNKSA